MSLDGYVEEWEVVGAVLAGWTACPVELPNSDFVRPGPSADGTNPATWISVEIEDANAQLTDFAGGEQVDCIVAISIYQQRRTGTRRLREHVQALRALFKAASTEQTVFLAPVLGNAETDDDWYARTLRVPYTWFVD
jgi:hypothetical protein